MKTNFAEITGKMEFHVGIALDRTRMFEISYYTLGSNSYPYFATESAKFIRSKKGYERCGQCQKKVLNGEAKRFWEKWDKHHLLDLDFETYKELVKDIEKLLKCYPYHIVRVKEDIDDKKFRNIGFTEFYELSFLPPKKR